MTGDSSLASTLRTSWHGFLETYEPLRPELYRYCRHLTRSPWDAEDLAQDALARAFATLGHGGIEARFMQGVLPSAPRVEAVAHRGEWILLHWYAHRDGEAVRAITRIEADPAGEHVALLQSYFFNPDFIAEVCAELALPWRSNGYRWFLPKG